MVFRRFPWAFAGNECRHAFVEPLGSYGKDFECEIVFPQPDVERAIEPPLDEDRIVPQHRARLDFFKLKPLVFELDREIVAHPPHAVDGEGGIQIAFLDVRERPVQVAFLRGGNLEVRIECGNENVTQEHVGFRDRRNSRKAQLFHEPVLQCPEQPLDPPFRFRAVGGDEFDAERFHHPLELGHEFTVVHGVFVIDLVGAVLVEVDAERLPALEDIALPETGNLDDALAPSEFGSRDRALGIVDRGQEAALVCPAFKPRVI